MSRIGALPLLAALALTACVEDVELVAAVPDAAAAQPPGAPAVDLDASVDAPP